MVKVTQELMFKFFMSYENAENDLVYASSLVELEVEPPHTVHKTLILDAKKLSKIDQDTLLLTDSSTLATGVFKLRLLERENIFGTHKEQVYILHSIL